MLIATVTATRRHAKDGGINDKTGALLAMNQDYCQSQKTFGMVVLDDVDITKVCG